MRLIADTAGERLDAFLARPAVVKGVDIPARG